MDSTNSSTVEELLAGSNISEVDDAYTDFNDSFDNFLSDCPAGSLLDDPPVRAVFIACYVLIFIGCLIGNLLLLVVVILQRSMRTTTNFFLANLAVADLLVAVFCIIQNLFHLFIFEHGHWPLGATMCHMYVFILHLVPSTGAGILILVSIERYIAVMHPILARRVLSKKLLIVLTITVWIISIGANVPYYLSTKYYQWTETAACGRDFDGVISLRDLHTVSFVIWYCIPLVTLGWLHLRMGLVLWESAQTGVATTSRQQGRNGEAKDDVAMVPLKRAETERKPPRGVRDADMETAALHNKGFDRHTSIFRRQKRQSLKRRRDAVEGRKKIIRLLIVLISAFALLILPHHARLLWSAWSPVRVCNSSPMVLIQPIAYLLLFLNSSINPFLYAFFSQRFRKAIKSTLKCAYNRGQGRASSPVLVHSGVSFVANTEHHVQL